MLLLVRNSFYCLSWGIFWFLVQGSIAETISEVPWGQQRTQCSCINRDVRVHYDDLKSMLRVGCFARKYWLCCLDSKGFLGRITSKRNQEMEKLSVSMVEEFHLVRWCFHFIYLFDREKYGVYSSKVTFHFLCFMVTIFQILTGCLVCFGQNIIDQPHLYQL